MAYGAPRAEFGWGHSIASLTDCISMVDRYDGDDRALPIVQALAGVADSERGRPVNPLPVPAVFDGASADDPALRRQAFRAAVESEQLEQAQSLVLGALELGAGDRELRAWFTDVVADHHLSYGHGAIYVQKAFELLDHLGWERAGTVLPYLVPTLVLGTREDKLPYLRPFLRGLGQFDLRALGEALADSAAGDWDGHDELLATLLGPDRQAAATATASAILAGAGADRVLDAVTLATSERMLRYDVTGERDFHDDFGWLDITHGLTYANAARWLVGEGRRNGDVDPADLARLVLWTAFQANWTGRHEWHTTVGPRPEMNGGDADLERYGARLQHDALLDGTTAFIVHAHAVKMSVAATAEAVHLGSAVPLDATARFLAAPKLERFVAATVTRSIDLLQGRVQRD